MRKYGSWKLGVLLMASLIFLSCDNTSDDDGGTNLRLLRTEADNYNGNVLHTEYEYDSGGRMVSIKQHENSNPPELTVTITYSDGEIKLLSSPKTEPLFNQTQEVLLSLDAHGKVLKKIGYTYGVGIDPVANPGESFLNDTLVYTYDAGGFLKEIKQNWHFSFVREEEYNRYNKIFSTTTFTTVSGKVTRSDKSSVYTGAIENEGVTTTSGGSSEYETVFNYTKAYPNRMDFKNAAVLNEYLDYYELFFDEDLQQLPDQVIVSTIDKDMDGAVVFTANSTVDMERIYNDEGLLSEVKVLTPNTQYRNVRYFYGK